MKEILETNKKLLFDNYGVDNFDDLFVMIANHKPSTTAVLEYLKVKRKENAPRFKKREIKRDNCPVRCKGAGKIAISLSNCCTPIPGDDIVGYITKGKGISVHRINCPNVANEKERLIEVFWSDDIEVSNYPVDIILECGDRPNLLSDIINCLSQQKVSCQSIHARLVNNGAKCLISATILVSDAKRLRDIFNNLLNLSSVYSVDRAIH